MRTEKYQTNDLQVLKRDALASQDIDMLRQTRAYDDHLQKHRFYYAKENEDVIRDRHGRQVDQKELPFPQYENSLHFASIWMVNVLALPHDRPGSLIRDIEHMLSHGEKASATILEVPAETSFPVPGGFEWWATTCLEYIESGKYVANPTPGHRHRLNGFGKSMYYNYHINGNRITSSQPPRDGSDYTTTIE